MSRDYSKITTNSKYFDVLDLVLVAKCKDVCNNMENIKHYIDIQYRHKSKYFYLVV